MDYLNYRKSISDELISVKDRVRNFIGGAHYGEDGRYKEIIVTNIIKKNLPSTIGVGTGFIVGENDQITKQIDIIIYDKKYPLLFSNGDFIIVLASAVYGIVEVKTKLNAANFSETIENSSYNGGIINNQNIFNGVIGLETDYTFSRNDNSPNFSTFGYVNNVSIGKDFFVKYWEAGNPNNFNKKECYSLYEIENLSFGYFISNLIEKVLELSENEMSEQLERFLYPIPEAKEAHKKKDIYNKQIIS